MISEQKRIEKARLRLELQHRRKVKQLHMRLENRKRKQKGEKTHIIISAPAAAAAESTAASKKKAAEQFAAEQLAADKLAAEQLAADQLVADKLIADFNNSKNSADVGVSNVYLIYAYTTLIYSDLNICRGASTRSCFIWLCFNHLAVETRGKST